MAAQLAHDLSTRIRLLVLEMVPYPLPIDEPDVTLPFTPHRDQGRRPMVRDPEKTIASILDPHSVVVLGGRCPWWPTAQGRLAERIKRNGHVVVYAE